jgi:hypothetical protein
MFLEPCLTCTDRIRKQDLRRARTWLADVPGRNLQVPKLAVCAAGELPWARLRRFAA